MRPVCFISEMHGNTVPQKLMPHTTDRYFRHAQNSFNSTRGKEIPDPNSFFEPVAKALQGADLAGHLWDRTGTAAKWTHSSVWLEPQSPELAGKIIGSMVVDEKHLTEKRTAR